jgi:hypothetical protein
MAMDFRLQTILFFGYPIPTSPSLARR